MRGENLEEKKIDDSQFTNLLFSNARKLKHTFESSTVYRGNRMKTVIRAFANQIYSLELLLYCLIFLFSYSGFNSHVLS